MCDTLIESNSVLNTRGKLSLYEISVKTQALQKKFMDIVQEMNDAKCPLPDNFELFYKVFYTKDRHGTVIDLRPFLTNEDAQFAVDSAIFDEELDREYNPIADKYASTTGHFVADSTTQAKIYNYETDHETNHEVNIDVTHF